MTQETLQDMRDLISIALEQGAEVMAYCPNDDGYGNGEYHSVKRVTDEHLYARWLPKTDRIRYLGEVSHVYVNGQRAFSIAGAV